MKAIKKHNINKFIKKIINQDILKVIVAIAGTLYIFLANENFAIPNIINSELFISVIVTFIVFKIMDMVMNKLNRHLEDDTKLTCDYEHLIERYKHNYNDMIKSSKNVVFPVVCIAKDIGNKELLIENDCNKMFELSPIVLNNYCELMKAHSHSDKYNNLNIRLDDCIYDSNNKKIILRTSRTTYFDSLVTNRAMDYYQYRARHLSY